MHISKNVCTFALEKERQRRIASLKGADKTVKCAACNVGIAHRSDGAGDKTVKVAASNFTTRPPRFYFDKLTNKNNTTMKRIYLSLPITGHEDTYEERLKELVKVAEGFARYQNVKLDYFGNYEIITPKDIAYRVEDRIENPKYTDYLLACLDAIVDCDIVILGDGWHESRGCRIEVNFAMNINMFVIEEELIKRNNWHA